MEQEVRRIHLDTHKVIQVGPGSPVTVRDALGRPFSAIVTELKEAQVFLTFRPRWAPSSLPAGHIISAGRKRVAKLDRVPEFQDGAAHV